MTTVVERVVNFIEENYADGISLSDVARALHYSPAHLTSVIRKRVGRPVTALIIERRLLAARERLLTTSEPVAVVGEAVGFRDLRYFERRFARAHGTSPSQWRTRAMAQPDICATRPACLLWNPSLICVVCRL